MAAALKEKVLHMADCLKPTMPTMLATSSRAQHGLHCVVKALFKCIAAPFVLNSLRCQICRPRRPILPKVVLRKIEYSQKGWQPSLAESALQKTGFRMKGWQLSQEKPP